MSDDFSEFQDLLTDFLSEAGELLDDVDNGLVALEYQSDDKALLNTVFRGFHTIKGGGGFLEATHLVNLCHRTENVFDRLRSDKMQLTPELLDIVLAATGEVRRMFGEMGNNTKPTAAPQELLDALDACLNEGVAAIVKPAPAAPAAQQADVPAADTASTAPVRSAGEEDAVDWDALYHELLGTEPTASSAPASDTVAATEEAKPKKVFSTAKPYEPKVNLPASSQPVKESSIRVETARFDQILNLSGEIGLTKNRIACLRDALIRGNDDESTLKTLDHVIGQLDMLVGDLQTSVMKARMQPVGRVFQKYQRLARDLSRQLGKDVDLVLEGAETEVDKTILDELNDPLVHIVRNSVDHGIENPVDRIAAGKPSRGTIKLSARQEGDHIIIEITDDGKGMNPDVIRQKAFEKGLISQEEVSTLDARKSLQLIFLPGFSTKDQISDVSGRGVGMDVVKTNITKLKGRIDLLSEPGRGSRIIISLPLTLAILPVLMLKQAEQTYALPLSSVREIISLNESQIQSVSGTPNIIVRGTVLPILDLAALLGKPRAAGMAPLGIVIVSGDRSFILGVDSMVGQDEVMIKPLEGLKPKGVAGATLSGEGVLVLVLELNELLQGWL
ncbi:chemotaxis protein CheA [Ampullimonas aquatilis]|uniref:chemotaxis protein CheA n=1 Tax=Ampullimonas aquatilis TaxID=1341549 RepID=UPI003C7763E8